MSAEVVFEISPDYFKRSQVRRKKRIEARRAKHSGVGRTDGPRKRKGEPAYLKGRRLRSKHLARLEKADAAKTHDVVFGVQQKTGRPVLKLTPRDAKKPVEIVTKVEAVPGHEYPHPPVGQ